MRKIQITYPVRVLLKQNTWKQCMSLCSCNNNEKNDADQAIFLSRSEKLFCRGENFHRQLSQYKTSAKLASKLAIVYILSLSIFYWPTKWSKTWIYLSISEDAKIEFILCRFDKGFFFKYVYCFNCVKKGAKEKKEQKYFSRNGFCS